MLAHNVYFTLKDRSDGREAKLVAACKAHLTGHPGVVFFACGTLAQGLDRPVNVRDFDVALHLASTRSPATTPTGRPQAPPVRRREPRRLGHREGVRLGGRGGLRPPERDPAGPSPVRRR